MSGEVQTAAPASIKTAALITHNHPETATDAVRATIDAAERASCDLVALADERAKLGELGEQLGEAESLGDQPDVCIVLGGDGSILYALRTFARTGVPVFGINFGTVGFLAVAERDELDTALEQALGGKFEVMSLPALVPEVPAKKEALALNDVSFNRRPQGRVAELAYRVGDEEVGHVRCDGIVAATPAGSTGYNLANGGPILAWGVEGYVASFIAPHTLTARALVVAPDDELFVANAAGREAVEIAIDGEHIGDLDPGEEIAIRFTHDVGSLAQLPGANFYRRIREKFGSLAR